MPKSASVPATSSVGSKPESSESPGIIIRNETDTAFNWSAMYGIIPTTTSTATSVPRAADLPYRLPMKSEIVVIRCSLATRTSLRSIVGHVSAISAGPR